MTIDYLRRCIELAAEAVDAGDHPFGSVPGGPDGAVLPEDRTASTVYARAAGR